MKKVIDKGKRSKTLSEVKQVENISKNLQNFLEIIPCKRKPFLHINCETMHTSTRTLSDYQRQLSHPGLSRIKQECQEGLIQRKIHNQQNSNEGLIYL